MPWTVFNRYGQRKYLTSSEIDAFIKSSKSRNADVETFCCMIALTGCRISEALEMTRNCIDFEAKHVIIRCLKKRGKRVFRAIPLPVPFLAHLKTWLRSRHQASESLWPWSRMTGYRRICEVMESAGIKGSYATPKGLRHGFGVRAIQAGVPLTLVQRWLGHADIKTTAIYTTAMGPEEREIASRMWQNPPLNSGHSKVMPSSRVGLSHGPVDATDEITLVNSDGDKAIIQNNVDEIVSNLSSGDDNTLSVKRLGAWRNSIKSIAEKVGSCSVLHFWLKCRDKNLYDSKAY